MHFLVAGLLVYIALGDSARSPDASTSRTIFITQANLIEHMQAQIGSANDQVLNRIFLAMSQEDRQALAADYFREEALYREALAMGLDRMDTGLRGRYGRLLNIVLSSRVRADTNELSDKELADYFADNYWRYSIPRKSTFAHIYLSAAIHGADGVAEVASSVLKEVNQKGVRADQAGQFGDHFMYHRNYVGKSQDEIASHFGGAFAKQVESLSPDKNTWYGPLESQFGLHLVMLTAIEEQKAPQFHEVRERVREDATEEQQREAIGEALDEIVGLYQMQMASQVLGE